VVSEKLVKFLKVYLDNNPNHHAVGVMNKVESGKPDVALKLANTWMDRVIYPSKEERLVRSTVQACCSEKMSPDVAHVNGHIRAASLELSKTNPQYGKLCG